MKFSKCNRNRKIYIAITAVIVVLLVIGLVFAIYVGDYYRADTDAIQAFKTANTAEIEIIDERRVAFSCGNPTKGFIFYPGGKVESEAYQPLMMACAEKGILCVLVEMPFNLAVFDIDAADGIQEMYPDIEDWYIGGHSLGGSMAASHIADNSKNYKGLVLLGSYSTADISDTGLGVLSVYGSEDKVLNREKYNKCRSNLPDDFTETVIDGGCHAYFGMYGTQDGDGVPSVTNEEQIRITCEEIYNLICKN